MSTPPRDLSFYGITQNTAYLQWFSTGADTNYADILCYAVSDPNTIVCSLQNIHTPNTQYYSDQITGLSPGKTYVCVIHTKYDPQGTGESVLVRSPVFTTLDDSSGDPAGTALVQQLVYVKTNIAGYFFDAFLQITHTSSTTITSHPVETGAAMTDHSFMNPAELVMQIGMTDVATSIIGNQFVQGNSRSVEAYQVLAKLQAQRVPMQVTTRLKVYKNMLIESISVPDDHTTLYGLRATVTMREVFVASVKTVKISARPHVTDSTNRGVAEPTPVKDQSALSTLIDQVLGKANPKDLYNS